MAPGPFRTPLNEGMEHDPQFQRFLGSEIPLHRWAELGELSAAALLLTDPGASFITGTILTVDRRLDRPLTGPPFQAGQRNSFPLRLWLA